MITAEFKRKLLTWEFKARSKKGPRLGLGPRPTKRHEYMPYRQRLRGRKK